MCLAKKKEKNVNFVYIYIQSDSDERLDFQPVNSLSKCNNIMMIIFDV